ncbi:hypothetical protein ALC53_12481 [Atta colombica]|uniref:Uncharacterized protein n=1 Tax=Atta colombica TaxID=520822 RepID=A0A195AYB2_9HYME|nr:hypothetical protein ALC53_12481 [Atta colombica]
MEEGEHNSVVFPSYEIDDQEISQGTIANLRDFSRDVCTTFLQYVPMTSRWETLTSNIKAYKNFCDALRPSLGKEIGTTVFALNGGGEGETSTLMEEKLRCHAASRVEGRPRSGHSNPQHPFRFYIHT